MMEKTDPKAKKGLKYKLSIQYELDKINPAQEVIYVNFAVVCGLFQFFSTLWMAFVVDLLYLPDAIIILALTIGIYKRSYPAALFMLVYFIFSIFYKISMDIDGSESQFYILRTLIFVFLLISYVKAILATLKIRNRLKAEGKLAKLEKRSFWYGVLVGSLITIILLAIISVIIQMFWPGMLD